MRFKDSIRATSSLAVLAMIAFAGAAAAQAPAPAPEDEEPATVDQIIVTAQKREQSLQDVPVVVTTVSEEQLEAAGVRDIKDLQILTPGMTVTSTSNESVTTARIRGVGTVGDNPGLESSVGVVIDGVYRARNGVGFGDLGELERIEVLKGPQGTLFGKNTSAGVINIITKEPEFNFGGEGEVTLGSYDAIGLAASVTGPINESLAGRLYVARREREGFYEVRTGDGPRTNTRDQDQNFYTIRGQLLFAPDEVLRVRAIIDYTQRDENCCAAVQIRSGPTANIVNALATGGQGVRPPAPGFAQLPFSRTAFSNRDTAQEITDQGFALEAEIDIPDTNVTFTSVTGIRDWDLKSGQDIDFSGADILWRDPDNFGFGVETFSQEFRLAGEAGRMSWLVGAFVSMEDLTRDDQYRYGSDYNAYVSLLLSNGASPTLANTLTGTFTPGGVPVAPGPGFQPGVAARDFYNQDSSSIALFTHEIFRITEQLEITAGLRWTTEDKTLDSLQTNPDQAAACQRAQFNFATGRWNLVIPSAAARAQALGALCLNWANPAYNGRAQRQEMSESEWSGTLKGSYRFNPQLMTYASYARGYKAGGFNLDRVTTNLVPEPSTAFPAETADSWELGAKTTWLNGTLLLNGTLFWQTFENFQLNTFAGVAFIVESIPEVESKGVDADLIWLGPIDGLTLTAGVTYAKTEYGEFTASDLTVPSRFPSLSLLPGAQMSFAPEWSITGSANYDREIGGLRVLANLSAKYLSDYSTASDLLPAKDQDAYTLLNGRVGFGAADERWTLELWGMNLTDQEYFQVGFNAPFQGTAFQATPQPNGTFYNPALDTHTYNAFLGQPRTYGVTLRVRY